MKKTRLVYYKSIPDELARLGLTQAQASKLLGISRSALNHRIKADSIGFHLEIYGLSHYLSRELLPPDHAHVD